MKHINTNHERGFLGESKSKSKPKPPYQEPESIRKYREERDRVIDRLEETDKRLYGN